MSAFCVPTPCIIPLRLPVLGESKIIDVETKLEILCETEIPAIEVFYTIDGTKPEPYIAIVQGSKTYKYIQPFSLPAGRITIKAIAVHSQYFSMCSSIITKTFKVCNVRRKSRRNDHGSPICDINSALLDSSSADTADSDELKESSGGGTNYDVSDLGVFLVDRKESIVENEDSDLESSNNAQDANKSVELEESQNLDVKNYLSDLRDLSTQTDENVDLIEMQDEAVECLKPHVTQSEIPFQHCSDCKKVNHLTSKYCENCGKKLFKTCPKCIGKNVLIANFCQHCGKKFLPHEQEAFETVLAKPKRCVGTMIKPHTANACTDVSSSVSVESTFTQTDFLPKNERFRVARMPDTSAGRGYWRQQVDYICDYLKIHTNNNREFREKIGEHKLHSLLSADVQMDRQRLSLRLEFDYMPA